MTISVMASPSQADALKCDSLHLPSLTLNPRQLNDLEMLLTGGFHPLTQFLGQQDYDSVINSSRLSNGRLWPIPITLDVDQSIVDQLHSESNEKQSIALRDAEGLLLAVMQIKEVWLPDLKQEAEQVFGTLDLIHPGVERLLSQTGQYYIAGPIQGIQTPLHYSFTDLWLTPEETRKHLSQNSWSRVIAFQTSRVIHRVHRDLLVSKAKELEANLLLHPSLGETRQGDIAAASRVHCYQAVLDLFPQQTLLALCPLALRQAGPRETLWHALIEQNYGASHFLVGPNDSSPRNASGEPSFYEPDAAQAHLQSHQNELDIEVVCVEQHVFDDQKRCFIPVSQSNEITPENQAGSLFREETLCDHMQGNLPIPDWWSFYAVLEALKPVYPPRQTQGFTLFFTGLSGSGKSTIANIVNAQLVELGTRPVTLLDGDIVRLNLSSELGFSREDRDINVRRIGFVANEITKNGGAALCAPIGPYTASRREVRHQIEPNGGFFEIFVSTPLAVCESRDRKGLYAKARAGIIPEFTGISDPYETPQSPELVIDTSDTSPLRCAKQVMTYLRSEGYLA